MPPERMTDSPGTGMPTDVFSRRHVDASPNHGEAVWNFRMGEPGE